MVYYEKKTDEPGGTRHDGEGFRCEWKVAWRILINTGSEQGRELEIEPENPHN
jgi:hypothetical protein